jgi:hypothetical protein
MGLEDSEASLALEEPLHDAGNVNNRKVVASCLLVPGRKPSVVLDAVEEDFHEVTFLVELLIVVGWCAARWMGPNHSLHAVSLYCLPDALAIVCSVGEEVLALRVVYQLLGNSGFMALSWGELDVERFSEGIYEGVDFRRKTSSGTSQSVDSGPPFPPAAC